MIGVALIPEWLVTGLALILGISNVVDQSFGSPSPLGPLRHQNAPMNNRCVFFFTLIALTVFQGIAHDFTDLVNATVCAIRVSAVPNVL